MSYCRLGPTSDVYVYEDVSGGFTCCFCCLHDGDQHNVATTTDMLAHLGEHITAGHKVPAEAIAALKAET